MLYNVSSNFRISFVWDMHNKYHNIPTEYEKLIFLVKIHETQVRVKTEFNDEYNSNLYTSN